MSEDHGGRAPRRSLAPSESESILAARRRAEKDRDSALAAVEAKSRELERAQATMRAAFESTADGILVTDDAGLIETFNGTFAEMWNLPLEVRQSRDHLQLVTEISRHLREPAQFLARTEEIRADRPSESVDLLELVDGRVFECLSRDLRAGEESIGRVWSVRDVTERRRAEEGWLRLAAVINSSDDAIVSKGLDSVITSWNAGAERIFGYCADEVIGRSITLIIPADRLHEESDILSRVSRGQRIDHFETVRLRKDGTRVDVSVTISPVCDASGGIVGVSKIARDITARKRAQETAQFLGDSSAALAELRDTDSTLQQVASLAVPFFADWSAVHVRDPDGSIRRLAAAHGEAIPAHRLEEIRARSAPAGADLFGVARVIRGGEPEWVREPAAGEEGPFRVGLGLRSYMTVPLPSRGEAVGALTFATAESGRAYGTPDLEAAQDLAHRVGVALENMRLLEVLKDSDRRKDEFLAILAHELRNPLAPIRNAVEVVRADPSETHLLWASELIDRQVRQLTRLVDDLLDVSRISRGHLQLRKERVTLAAVVASAVDASRPLLDERGHAFTVVLPEEAIDLEADLTRLSQVLLNLLNNAAKYTDPGGRISLTAERVGGEVELRVADNGIGIAPEMLPRIFDMFVQVDRSLERSRSGLGIGLTLVRRIVALHGGSVDARSAGLGKGSEFIVRLPIAGAPRETRSGAAAGGSVGAAPRRRILVVDDNEDAAESLELLLRLFGNETRAAHDGLDAVAVAEEFQPDVVLLDIGLPTLNGYDAARRIRAALGNAVTLIAITGWGQEEDRRLSAAAGFDHHLTKPVDIDVLRQLL